MTKNITKLNGKTLNGTEREAAVEPNEVELAELEYAAFIQTRPTIFAELGAECIAERYASGEATSSDIISLLSDETITVEDAEEYYAKRGWTLPMFGFRGIHRKSELEPESEQEEPGCSAWVRLDGDSACFLAKHVADDEWNGFARPSFCAQEAKHIADHMNELDWFSGTCEFDEEGECFLCYEDSELVERFDAIEINGELLYPIGRGSWTWILDEVV